MVLVLGRFGDVLGLVVCDEDGTRVRRLIDEVRRHKKLKPKIETILSQTPEKL